MCHKGTARPCLFSSFTSKIFSANAGVNYCVQFSMINSVPTEMSILLSETHPPIYVCTTLHLQCLSYAGMCSD